jgi:hypothetical protein
VPAYLGAGNTLHKPAAPEPEGAKELAAYKAGALEQVKILENHKLSLFQKWVELDTNGVMAESAEQVAEIKQEMAEVRLSMTSLHNILSLLAFVVIGRQVCRTAE